MTKKIKLYSKCNDLLIRPQQSCATLQTNIDNTEYNNGLFKLRNKHSITCKSKPIMSNNNYNNDIHQQMTCSERKQNYLINSNEVLPKLVPNGLGEDIEPKWLFTLNVLSVDLVPGVEEWEGVGIDAGWIHNVPKNFEDGDGKLYEMGILTVKTNGYALAFADRPGRYSMNISLETLINLWKDGEAFGIVQKASQKWKDKKSR